jgi:hypothetical protein
MTQESTMAKKARPRARRVAVYGRFAPDERRQLKSLAVEHDTTVQRLIEEAVNDLFVKYCKPPIR